MKKVYLDNDGIHKYEVYEVNENTEKVAYFELMGGKWVKLGPTECYDKSIRIEITFGMKRVR